MSINLSNVFVDDFVADMHHEYRSMGFLTQNAVRTKMNIVGETTQFPVMGQGIAQQKASQDKVIPMNVSYTPKVVTFAPWHASEYTGIFDQASINWDDKRELMTMVTAAIGRRRDQIVIDALSTGATNTVGDYTAAMSFDIFSQAYETLQDNGAMSGEKYGLISASAERQLLADSKVTSTDYVNYQPIAGTGFHFRQIMDVKFLVIPSMTEGGLPLSGTQRKCYMFDKNSVGYGSSIDFKAEVNYIPDALMWLTTGMIKAGATVIDPRGVVELRIKNDA